jgi:hypothetical protein
MKRDYTDGVKEDITYFTGIEIEHTPAYGMKTLFVVSIQRSEEIIALAKEKDCRHIYFGANQSFPKINCDDARGWKQWEVMIQACLDTDFWCTLDLDVNCAEGCTRRSVSRISQIYSATIGKLTILDTAGI